MNQTTPTLANLGSSNWIATIYGSEELVLKLTKFKLPGVDAGVTAIGNRTEFVMQTGGDHIQYDNLEVEFLVDENLLNYIKLYKWMRENAKRGIEENVSISIHFIGNDKKFQGVEVEFYESFPISLSDLELDTDGNETDVHCTATFAYTAFDFVEQTDRDLDLDLTRFQ
jgi:hypothetical protein